MNSAGFDWILKSKLFSPSFPKNPTILLTGASGVHAKVIGEHVISLSLALFHRVNWLAIKGWNERKWTPVDRIRGIGGRSGLSFIRELGGQTMGVLGYGHVSTSLFRFCSFFSWRDGAVDDENGQRCLCLGAVQLGRESARLAKAFGMDVLACNSTGVRSVDNGFVIPGSGDPEGAPTRILFSARCFNSDARLEKLTPLLGLLPSAWYSSKKPSSFREFLSRTDVLVVALPLTPSTRHIISSTALSHLSPTSIIINVGRGPLVDTTALLDALRSERIGGAGLDVTDPEPLPDGHELWGFDNVVITPHISWAGLHVREAHVQLFVQQTDRVRSRKAPYNVFDPDRGY